MFCNIFLFVLTLIFFREDDILALFDKKMEDELIWLLQIKKIVILIFDNLKICF
jgi:hypothetical protein